MSPAIRRAVITTLVLIIATGVVAIAMISGGGSRPGSPASSPSAPGPAPGPAPAPESSPSDRAASAAFSGSAPDPTPAPSPDMRPGATTPSAPGASSVAAAPTAAVERTSSGKAGERTGRYSTRLAARVPGGAEAPGEAALSTLGSLDPEEARFRLRFHPRGAGITEIVFSEFWLTAQDRIAFEAHRRAVGAGRPNPPPLPPDSQRYVLSTLQRFGGASVPLLAAIDIMIDDEQVLLLADVWTERAPGVFATEIVDTETGEVVMVIERRFEVTPGGRDVFGAGYDIGLVHRFENRTGREVHLSWSQCGPGDLTLESGGFMDVRRFQFGYLYNAQRDPSRQVVIVHGASEERSAVLSRIDAGQFVLWPRKEQLEAGYEICWFGTTSRYFALAVHGPFDPPAQPSKSAAGLIEEVGVTASPVQPDRTIVSTLRSPSFTVPASSEGLLDLRVFAGPLDPRVLDHVEPYRGLNMSGLILYQISGCCSWCTFAWLALLIVHFLMFLHDWVVFDWGLAIIVLVVIVRIVLHPLTKYSQVNMQRFARSMQELKPELDALMKRYADDPKRLQAEQRRLYHEKGVNPVGCIGGILPTLLQTPVWIALYAVLYFAFDLRQQPAFFGIFQLFGGWQFLGDLSAPDHFITFPFSLNFWLFTLEGINLIPILMGVVFWFSQKYMTPPPTTKLTPEQESQQKMMKWMMVLMFPIFLFKAPAGLTLYILTSTIVGIFEGRAIRKQIERMDLSPRKREPKKKSKDLMGRMYAEALERRRNKPQGPPRKFKERG